jgi:Tfp pilus assembly protein PilF
MADVQRLQGQRARQVEGYLEGAFAQAPEHREARLVRAMTLAASERERGKARELFEALVRSAEPGERDVRPAYRLALLDFAESRPDDARRRAQEVLAGESAHEGARALIARLDANPAVDTSDPMPPEETPADGPGGSGKDDSDRGGSYDSLVSRAASKAKDGKCGDAMELYERALDVDPSGVDALMGMAECHLDRKEFASAHGKFQAVLGVSRSNPDALWGMAETYRKQGLGTQAVSWYRKYLEEHPSGSRASRARRRIDELDGGSQSPPADPSNGSGSGSGSGSGAAPTPTPPAGNDGTEPPAGQGSPPAGGTDSP